MDSCKYHPLEGAAFSCHECNLFLCGHCIDDSHNKKRCFICESNLNDLGSANTIQPFWRRLPEAFKYPLNSSSLSLIFITAILSVIASLIGIIFIIAVPLYLFATGALFKYSFTCLERTADGEMTAPDVMEAYTGGIKLVFQLFLIVLLLSFLVLGAYHLSATLGGVMGLLAMVALPAILIQFAQTESVLEALNPITISLFISSIGLPYGLLMAFLIIMMSSVGVLHELVGAVMPSAAYFVQIVISNYYTIVIFHLMGYMLFQYQAQLGYIARSDEDEVPARDEAGRIAAKILIFLKEGSYDKVAALYYQAFKLFPNDASFFNKYFELINSSKNASLMKEFALLYLEFLYRTKRVDKLTISFRKIQHLVPNYLPDSPVIRVQLAHLLQQQGDLKLAVKLLNGLHKCYPDYAELPEAYSLLAAILTDLPNMEAQADKCQKMVEQLKRRAAQKSTSQPVGLPVAANTPNPVSPPQTKRKGPPPPGNNPSGLVLELVPLEPVIDKME